MIIDVFFRPLFQALKGHFIGSLHKSVFQIKAFFSAHGYACAFYIVDFFFPLVLIRIIDCHPVSDQAIQVIKLAPWNPKAQLTKEIDARGTNRNSRVYFFLLQG